MNAYYRFAVYAYTNGEKKKENEEVKQNGIDVTANLR